MSDFWNTFVNGSLLNRPSVMDEYLGSDKKANADVYYQTDRGKEERALKLPLYSGTRVAFDANLESIMGTKNPPSANHPGTVVMVRTAAYGDITSLGDYVFVKWDRGDLQKVDRHYLKKASNNVKQASQYIQAFNSTNIDFSNFLRVANTDDLVHKATQDLWSCQQNDKGEVVISRLFDETGGPLKV